MNFNFLTRIKAALLSKVQKWKGPEARRVNAGHVLRNEKVWDKIGWRAFRSARCLPRGGPVLKGARLARVQEQCSPKHLTVLCRGAAKSWSLLGDTFIRREDINL